MNMVQKICAIYVVIVFGLAMGANSVMAKEYTVLGGTFAMADPEATYPINPGSPGVLKTGEYQPWNEIVDTFQFGLFGNMYCYTNADNTGLDYEGVAINPPGAIAGGPPPSVDLAFGTHGMSGWFINWGGNEIYQGNSGVVTDNGDRTYTLNWSKIVSSGPFDGQTGYWTLDITCSDDPPVVEEPEDLIIMGGEPFVDPGLVVTDDDDDYSITVHGVVDAHTPGNYDLMYTVTDSCVRTSTYTRTVTVVSGSHAPILTVAPAPLNHIVGTPFNPMTGVTCIDPEDGDLTISVVVTANDVDENTLGAYAVSYSCTDSESNPATYENRVVNVIENTPPEINLSGETTVSVEACTAFVEPGVSCTDAEDGDLTSLIVVDNPVDENVPGTYTITYDCQDSHGVDATQVTLDVVVEDTTGPEFNDGNGDATIELGATYTDGDALNGISCNDCVDGGLTSAIVVDNPVDTTTEGSYTVTYTCTDGAGNEATAIRTVHVETADAYCGITSVGANNFTMITNLGETFTGANDVVFTWDGTLNTDVATAVVNATLSSQAILFDHPWTIQDMKVFGPGTYTFDTCVNSLAPDCTPLTVTVGADQVGAHMYFNWHDSNTDVFNVWGRNAVFAPSEMYSSGGGNSDQVWDFMSTDGDGDSVNGITLVNGPFVGLRANFNLMLPGSVPQMPADVPVLVLEGDNPLLLSQGDAYADPLAHAVDLKDGCLESIVITSTTPGDMDSSGSDVDTDTPGVYARTYQVSDSDGNVVREELLIIVVGSGDFSIDNSAVVTGETGNHPVIVLEGGQVEINLILGGDTFVDPGAIAVDLQDGALEVVVQSIVHEVDGIQTIVSEVDVNVAGKYTVTYSVTDQGGNTDMFPITSLASDGTLTTTATRIVRVMELSGTDTEVDAPVSSSGGGCSISKKVVYPMSRGDLLCVGVFILVVGVRKRVKS